MEHEPTMPLPPPGSPQQALMQVPHEPAERRCDGHSRAPSLLVHAAQHLLNALNDAREPRAGTC